MPNGSTPSVRGDHEGLVYTWKRLNAAQRIQYLNDLRAGRKPTLPAWWNDTWKTNDPKPPALSNREVRNQGTQWWDKPTSPRADGDGGGGGGKTPTTGGGGGKTPTAKPKAKSKNPFDVFEKALKTPKLEVPTLVQPDLDPIPTLQTAALEDYNVAPIEIGPLPTLEAIPDQQPVVEIDDRQSARMRRTKLAQIAQIKDRRGVGATLLSGPPTPARATGVPANQMARAQLGDNRTVMTRKGV